MFKWSPETGLIRVGGRMSRKNRTMRKMFFAETDYLSTLDQRINEITPRVRANRRLFVDNALHGNWVVARTALATAMRLSHNSRMIFFRREWYVFRATWLRR